jgi:hypothetical protein
MDIATRRMLTLLERHQFLGPVSINKILEEAFANGGSAYTAEKSQQIRLYLTLLNAHEPRLILLRGNWEQLSNTTNSVVASLENTPLSATITPAGVSALSTVRQEDRQKELINAQKELAAWQIKKGNKLLEESLKVSQSAAEASRSSATSSDAARKVAIAATVVSGVSLLVGIVSVVISILTYNSPGLGDTNKVLKSIDTNLQTLRK